MRQKVTKDKVLASIIRLINEYREDCVEPYASLGRLHIGPRTLNWMFSWLRAEYDDAKMTAPTEDEISKLVQGDTIETLADIAMKHVEEGAEHDDGEPDPHAEGAVTKTVAFHFTEEESENGTVNSSMEPKEMTREEFLKVCGEFYDNRGTHIDDFPLMAVKIFDKAN